jgi:hypothetical protein
MECSKYQSGVPKKKFQKDGVKKMMVSLLQSHPAESMRQRCSAQWLAPSKIPAISQGKIRTVFLTHASADCEPFPEVSLMVG